MSHTSRCWTTEGKQPSKKFSSIVQDNLALDNMLTEKSESTSSIVCARNFLYQYHVTQQSCQYG
jgi:hypothetical protein